MLLAALGLVTLATSTLVSAKFSDFSKCQLITSDPLHGCPEHTLYVSATNPKANYSTVQSAIDAVPQNNEKYHILIAPGNYTEQLNVTRPGPLYLLGTIEGNNTTPYADIGYNTSHSNLVQIVWHSANVNGTTYTDNVYTSTLIVAPTLNSSLTGSGPTGAPVPPDTPLGNSDFRAYNIDFVNYYTDSGVGPSLTITIAYANASFYSCGHYSYQDTIFVGKLGNTYFYDNIIAGETDFLYGFGTAYIENSTLSRRNCGGGLTAWKGTNTTFENKYGVYISDSSVLASNLTVLANEYHTCALGRPWNGLDRTVIMNTYLDATTLPAGYISWGGVVGGRITDQTFMAVWDNFGPGVNITAENATELNGYHITIVLQNATEYRWPADVFQYVNTSTFGNVGWIDKKYLVGPKGHKD